ncbi:MAG TPA: hypothetical protein VJ986_04755 [Gaiellaceae bacterium]|nr:hypothetical protein [Gaiellaceae bacterium]
MTADPHEGRTSPGRDAGLATHEDPVEPRDTTEPLGEDVHPGPEHGAADDPGAPDAADLELRERRLEQMLAAVEAQRERLVVVREEYEHRREELMARARELELARDRLRAREAELSLQEQQTGGGTPSPGREPRLRSDDDAHWWSHQLGSPFDAA